MRRFRLFVCLAFIAIYILFGCTPAQGAPVKPVTERQLLAWMAAEIPAWNIQSELQSRGVNFALNEAWRVSLKQAGGSAQLIRALEKVQPPATPAPPDAYTDRLWRVVRDVNTKKYVAASMHMASMVKANRTDADLLIALGWTIGKQENWGEAIPPLMEAVRLDPDSGYAHELLSYASYNIGNGDLAVKEGKAAVALRPRDPDSYKYLGLAYDARREYQKSAAAYEHALRLKPDYAAVFYDMGISFANQGRLRESVESYQRAIELDGSRWRYYSNMGNVLSSLNRWDEAIAAEKRAKDLAPDELTVRQNLGAAYCNSGRSQEAVNESEELLAMDPNWNMARLCLYKSLTKLGRTEEAKQVKDEYDKREAAEAPVPSSE